MKKDLEKFKNKVLKEKKVSLWGLGYLGYTTLIMLQNKGFKCDVFDFSAERMKNLKKGNYPEPSQIKSWSELNNCPPVNINKINIAQAPKDMFDANIHLIAVPNEIKNFKEQTKFSFIADIFKKHSRVKTGEKILVIFLSASYPGSIEEQFIKKTSRLKNIITASAFRNDWNIEKFISGNYKYSAAADKLENTDYLNFFFEIIEKEKNDFFDSIKDSELNENLRNVLEWGVTSICNQVMFAFPNTNIRNITKTVLKNIDLKSVAVKISSGGYKYPMAIRNIFKSAHYPEFLTVLKEIQSADLSEVMQFVDFAKRRKVKRAGILGITTYINKKEIEFSPSVILADALHNAGIKVFINDPLYSKEEIKEIFSDYDYFDINEKGGNIDILFLMTPHSEYSFYNQRKISDSLLSKVSYIIDNEGLWKNMEFPENVTYYAVGSGKLDILK